MKRNGYDNRLEQQRDRRRDVELRRILDVGLPGDGQRQNHGMQRVDVEQRIEPVLVEQHEAHQDQRTCEEMRDVEIEVLHLEAPRHEEEERGEQGEHQRGSQKFRHAEYAHLGDGGFEHRKQEAAGGELGDIGGDADQHLL